MNDIMNKTNNGKRLLAAVAVLALIACAFVALAPTADAAEGDKLLKIDETAAEDTVVIPTTGATVVYTAEELQNALTSGDKVIVISSVAKGGETKNANISIDALSIPEGVTVYLGETAKKNGVWDTTKLTNVADATTFTMTVKDLTVAGTFYNVLGQNKATSGIIVTDSLTVTGEGAVYSSSAISGNTPDVTGFFTNSKGSTGDVPTYFSHMYSADISKISKYVNSVDYSNDAVSKDKTAVKAIFTYGDVELDGTVDLTTDSINLVIGGIKENASTVTLNKDAVFSGTILNASNAGKLTVTSMKAGENGITLSLGSLIIDGEIEESSAITVNGPVTMSGTAGAGVNISFGADAVISVPSGESLDISKAKVTSTSTSKLMAGADSDVTLPSGFDTKYIVAQAAPGATIQKAPASEGGNPTPVDGSVESINVTTFDELKNAVELGFPEINMAIDIAVPENFTLTEGTTLTINATSAAVTLTVNANATFTVANGANIILDDGTDEKNLAKIYVSEDASMFVGGNIIGPEGETEGLIDNDGTVSFDTTAEVKTDMIGDGIYNLSDAMKTVYVREDVNSNLVFLPQQTVIVEFGYNITISGTSRMVVQGKLIVEEGASINVTKGGLLYVYGNTASATIAGTVTSNGASIVKSNNVALAGVTVDLTNAQSDESVIDISGTLQSRACNDELAINLVKNVKGSIELSGALTVANKSTAAFDGLEVLEGGVLTVNGTIDKTEISNAGTVVMNGTVVSSKTMTVVMGVGGIVDIRSLTGTMVVTDSGMYLSMVRVNDANKAAYVGSAPAGTDNTVADWTSANSIKLENIRGAYITEDAPYEVVDNYDNRMPVNKMYLSGTLTGAVKDIDATVSITMGKVIVPDLEAETDLSIGKAKLTVNNATLDVVGYVMAVDTENAYAFAAVGTGNIVVSAGTIKSYNAIEFSIKAVHYEAVETGVTYNYYTTLAQAIENGATDMEALGTLDILEDITLPTGTSLDATTVNVGSSDVQDITFTIENDAEFTAGTVNVYGTMDVADVNDIYVSAVYSDTETLDGDHAIYTNLANALANADDGTVTITKKGDGIVYLTSNATVKENVTLAIPAGKQLYIENGVTLTVAGTVDNKGGVSAFYYDDKDAVTAGAFGTETGTGTDAEKKAVIDLDGGLIQSTTEMTYDKYFVPGAYYSVNTGKSYIITTIEKAAPAIGTADAKLVKLYGEVVGTTVTFTGEEYYTATVEVYGDLTMDSLVLKDAIMNVKAAAVLNGAFGSAEGSVTFEHVQVAAGFYLSDRIVESGDVKTPTLFMNGTVNKDLDADYAFAEALVQYDGVVKNVNVIINLDGSKAVDSTGNAIAGAENGNVVIAAGADVAFAKNLSNDNMAMTVSNLDRQQPGPHRRGNPDRQQRSPAHLQDKCGQRHPRNLRGRREDRLPEPWNS